MPLNGKTVLVLIVSIRIFQFGDKNEELEIIGESLGGNGGKKKHWDNGLKF